MKFLSLVALSTLVFYNVCVAEDRIVPPEPKPPNTTTSSTTVTTPLTTPSSPTTIPTTSSPTTTSSTPAPTSPAPTTPAPTTPAPTTPAPTTPAPTTSTSAPTSSTSPPTSSTTAQPTTTPSPAPRQGMWQVNDTTANNTACILVKMAVAIDVTYTNVSNKTQEGQIYVPVDATSTGNCGGVNDTKQSMKLTWSSNPNFTDTLEFIFNKTDDKFDLETINIKLSLDPVYFPAAKEKSLDLVHENIDFVTPVAKSYQCKKEQSLPLYETKNQNITVGSVKISEFQFQAFSHTANNQFADAIDCEIETPDVVPIAVGCALMALIIIVLIGYLIGRRRNQARGYLSMFTETKREADYIPMKNLSCFQ